MAKLCKNDHVKGGSLLHVDHSRSTGLGNNLCVGGERGIQFLLQFSVEMLFCRNNVANQGWIVNT